MNQGFIRTFFGNIKDPRAMNIRHNLIDIITIAICSVICSADTWQDISDYGISKYDWFKEFLELPYGIPSPDTFARIFARIDPDEFRSSFINWVKSISSIMDGKIIAIDGKTLRRSYDNSSDKSAIHMVSAWASQNGIVLGQVKTNEKSNEITAIPELIKMLEISGCIVTIDAMGCQKNIANLIIDNNADYLLTLKANQGNLYNDVRLYFEHHINTKNFEGVKYFATIDGDHGRIETRKHWVTSDIDWLPDKSLWHGIHTIAMVQRERDINGKVSTENSFYISSLTDDPFEFARTVRAHWGIENSLHWVLDISFREDECRIRKNNAPENFVVLRHIAVNLIKQETSSKRGVKGKRLKAGWDNAYLRKILLP